MASRTRTIARWVRSGVAVLAGVAVLVLVAGAVYQYVANRRDLRDHPAPGQLVDVGGHRLHLWCTGSGAPVVILEAGIGGASLEWNHVQPHVARTTRVCSYDRAGLGWSDPGPHPRSASQLVGELHTLLAAAGVPGPYVMVGHSSGGLYVRLYASTYPNEVDGMVLVDAAHEDQRQRMPAEAGAGNDNPFVLHLHSFLTVVGYARLTGIRFVRDYQLGPQARHSANGIRVRTTWPFAYAAESTAAEESEIQVRHARRQAWHIPLVVVTRGRYEGLRGRPQETQDRIRTAWGALQADLVTLSSQGTQILARESDHYVHLTQPAIVVDAIGQVVAAARGSL